MSNDQKFQQRPDKEKMPTVKELLVTNNDLLRNQQGESRRKFIADCVLIITTIFLAITAGCDALTNREDVLSRRPFISLDRPTITKKEEYRYNFVAELRNIGGRATAPGATMSVYPIKVENKDGKTIYTKNPPDPIFISNELIPGSPVITYNFDFPLPEIPQFFIVKIKYKDAIINDSYPQLFFYNWVVGGSLTIVKDEKVWKELSEYFKEND